MPSASHRYLCVLLNSPRTPCLLVLYWKSPGESLMAATELTSRSDASGGGHAHDNSSTTEAPNPVVPLVLFQ